LAFFDSSSLSRHFWPLSKVLGGIAQFVTPKISLSLISRLANTDGVFHKPTWHSPDHH
jgi:hypothetical protein